MCRTVVDLRSFAYRGCTNSALSRGGPYLFSGMIERGREGDALGFDQDLPVHILHSALHAGLAALGLHQADLEDDELVCAGRGLVVDVEVRRYADLFGEVQEGLAKQR